MVILQDGTTYWLHPTMKEGLVVTVLFDQGN